MYFKARMLEGLVVLLSNVSCGRWCVEPRSTAVWVRWLLCFG